jgi:hypothetical protein
MLRHYIAHFVKRNQNAGGAKSRRQSAVND